MKVENLIEQLKSRRLPILNEKETQAQIGQIFAGLNYKFAREYKLDNKNIIDFYIFDGKIGIEVKLRSPVFKTYSQCARYCQSDKIDQLLLITSKSMGLPKVINGKPCHIHCLSTSWL